MAEHARITEEALQQIRQRMGVPVRRRQPHIQLATPDAIRHFAHGIVDANPLWTDPAYAATTRYGCVIAPPCILYTMDDTTWLRATVTDKSIRDGEPLGMCDVWAENQRGEVTTQGKAEARLLSRQQGGEEGV